MRYLRYALLGLLALAALALPVAGASDGTAYDDELPSQALLAPRSPSLLRAICAAPAITAGSAVHPRNAGGK